MSAYKSVHGPSQSYVLIKALKAALDEIAEEGIEHVWRRHEIASRALREGMRAMGFEILASEENAAWDATCVIITEGEFDVKRFMRTMWTEHGIATAGGSPNREAAGYAGFRIGCMGKPASPEYILPFLAAAEQVLAQMGYPVNAGAALPVAQAIFAEGA
jgi:aspartate aminotransferase-like enzyme